MKHFGIISPPVSGHVHPMGALGRELISRGHRVTYFQMLDLEDKVRSEGLDFEPIGESDHPRGSLPVALKQLGHLGGFAALRFTIGQVAKTSVMLCRDGPAAIRQAGVDVLLVDQMEPAGGAVAEHLDIPFVTLCNALAVNRDPAVPPPFTPWRYRDTAWARIRNSLGYAVSDWVMRPIMSIVADYRRSWGLRPLSGPDDSFSKIAQISQMPKEFDFPRSTLPERFHYVGPLRRAPVKAIPFPWNRLDGRPIVYASLGTLQNSRAALFRCFAEACDGLEVQLVISHGGGLDTEEAAGLPGSPLVVAYAPQLEVLERASLAITHAGLNTVLDSLMSGVPMVAVPIAYEQPAIARRIERAGAGRAISLHRLTASLLRKSLVRTLSQPREPRSPSPLACWDRAARGTLRAAEIVEGMLP
jgi:MGT family glycosyltransferase